MEWRPEQVLALAPDPASAKAGQGLARPDKWLVRGRDDRAAWGEMQGSGKEPYRVRIDLSEPAFKCSCPSRKFPCKHGLGLLLMIAQRTSDVPVGSQPDWTREWLESRAARAEKKTADAASPASTEPADPEAAARRASKRQSRVSSGVDQLGAWLSDVVREGLASAPSRPSAYWDAAAARMVDAQAPGLARMLSDLGDAASSGPGWQDRMIDSLARIHLLVEAQSRLDALDEATRDDVRALLGFVVPREQVLAGPEERGELAVLSRRIHEEGKLRVRRTWLMGSDGRASLVLDFAAGRSTFDAGLVPGTTFDATICRFPGALGQRVLVKERHGDPTPFARPPGRTGIDAALGVRASALASSPWIERWPMLLADVRIVAARAPGDRLDWLVVDDARHALPLATRPHLGWHALATSGGLPCDLFGEWDGRAFLPLALWQDGSAWLTSDGDAAPTFARIA